jgi:PIN domain nuclease of toxin-antitoxin system
MSSAGYVLDASALLAALNEEPGAQSIQAVLEEAQISAVNLSEVVAKLQDRGVPDAEIDEILIDLDLRVAPFDADQAVRAGKLRAMTRSQGLSLGDRACLALAASTGATALTTDKAWTKLKLDVRIEQVR